ncbi:MAG: DUF3734 domain-containing protein [Sphingomonadales bacterium]
MARSKQGVSEGRDGYDKKVALVLQGGGALGSYQAGVFECLADSPYQPDWVAGISIGGINAAIIAGNAPEHRVDRLRAFWQGVTAPSAWWPGAAPGQRQAGAAAALLFGQPGFFAPRPPWDWFGASRPASVYDTSALKATLESLIDFDRINHKDGVRLSLGAVNVETGQFAYFDSHETTIRPEHVMASGALPPGFPAVEIDGAYYWDGGLVSNTPLQYVLDYVPRRSMLIFQVDVFRAHGQVPRDLSQVIERDKDIRYSSRTRIVTETFKLKHDVRHNINELYQILPDDLKQTDVAKWLYDFGCVTLMDVALLIYRPDAPQGPTKDYEFSRATMDARWAQGRADAQTTLAASPWMGPRAREEGLRVFDVIHDILVKKANDGKRSKAS